MPTVNTIKNSNQSTVTVGVANKWINYYKSKSSMLTINRLTKWQNTITAWVP